jgi:hypothetical protein
MPPDLWRDDIMDRAQRHARCVEASARIVELERERDEAQHYLREAIEMVKELVAVSGGAAPSGTTYHVERWPKAAGLEESKSTPPATITGRVVEVGNLECLDNAPGLIIETTMEQLRAHAGNLAFCEVEIRVRQNTKPRGGLPSAPANGSAPVAERNCSHVGGWRKCAECGRETWNTDNGLCIRCRPNKKDQTQ